MEALTGVVRNRVVVMAELRHGAVAAAERRFLRALGNNHSTRTPTEKNWLQSGAILAKIRADRGLTAHTLRDMHFDVRIALTARAHGARRITSNRAILN